MRQLNNQRNLGTGGWIGEFSKCRPFQPDNRGRFVRSAAVAALIGIAGLQLWLQPSSFAAASDAGVTAISRAQTADIIDDIINILGGGGGGGSSSGGGEKP